MKNLTAFIIALALVAFSQHGLYSQCVCNFNTIVEQDPDDPCCLSIRICTQGGNPDCVGVFDMVQFVSNNFPPNIAEITSATPGPGMSASLVDQYTATFSSPVPFNSILSECLTLGQYILVGTVCLDDAANITTGYEVSIMSNTGQSCVLENGEFPIPCMPPPIDLVLFEKLYGDTSENMPTKIKAFGDGIYVAGTRRSMGILHATFSKFNLTTGALEWDFRLIEGSIFHDFEYVPDTDEFLLVGATEPFQAGGMSLNNSSILVKVDDSGSLVFRNQYQQLGREHFNRIIRHPNPKNPAFPFYIVGTKNPPASPPTIPPPPSTVDQVFVLNIDAAGTVNWAREYDYPGSPDDEFHRGLFAVNTLAIPGIPGNGDIVITGNDAPVGNGILVKIDGGNGNALSALRYDGGFDIYDGMELPGGGIALAGADFANDQAFIGIFNPLFQLQSGLLLPDVKEFREIGRDAAGQLYALGHAKNGNLPIVHQFFQGASLSLGYQHYLYDNEADWKNGRIAVTPDFDRIFYADGRIGNAAGFGGYDLLVGSFDLDLSAACRTNYDGENNPLNMMEAPIMVAAAPMALPSPGSLHETDLDYGCNDFCSPGGDCEALFQWGPFLQLCYALQFTNSSTGAAPLTLSWDVNGTPYSANTFFHQFPSCGDYLVCLTITDANGCMDTYCETVTVVETIPPVFTNCPPSFTTVFTDPGTCTACLDPLVTAIDNCDPNPTIVYMLSGSTTGDNPNTCYELGFTTVTAIAFDDCGNQSVLPCEFTIFVRDPEAPAVNCQDLVIHTDPGECTALFTPMLDVSDNCDPDPTVFNCTYTHPVLGTLTGPSATLGLGTWTITCSVADFAGNVTDCTFTVLVTDNEPPTIQCPPNQTIQVPGCSEGSVAFFDLPTVGDNCPGVTYVCDPPFQSGDFFPCGTTTITCTATDAAGLTASCSHKITVNGCNDCVEIVSTSIECTEDEGCYSFTIVLENLTLNDFCDATISVAGADSWAFDCNTGLLTGTICVPAPYPLQLPLSINVSFPDCGSSSSVLVLQPDALQGKDAAVSSFSPTSNSGNAVEISAQRWTIGASWFTARSYLDFDWSAIPPGATITSAVLELKGASGTFNNYLFPCFQGDNDMYLTLVSNSWNEATVTWNNKPATSTNPAHRINISPICLPGNGQHGDLTVDVTSLVNAVLASPSSFHGFELALQIEAPNQYRAYIARSSDDPDPEKRPKLTLQFEGLSCTLPVNLTTPCCEEVSVDDQSVCKTAASLTVPLEGPASLASDLIQVDWYVDADCDGGFVLLQSTPDWSDLLLYPSFYPAGTSSLCVYAVMSLANNPCETITSNTATITLCQPAACSVVNGSQQYCHNDTPISVLPLTVQVEGPDCDYTVQWYMNGTLIPGATSDSYQPGDLSHIPGSNNDCFTSYHFSAEVTNLCGTQTCTATITIYNEHAPPGQLDMVPLEPQPFCPSEDATLVFTPECPENGTWTWHSSTVSSSGPFGPIAGAGEANPAYNTNQLFQSTWYEVEVKNGVCPADRVPYFIEVKPPLSIVNFSAEEDNICDPSFVLMQIELAPPPMDGCEYVIYWYKDATLVHTSTTTLATAAFQYFDPQLAYDGNYYAIVEDDCCQQRLKSPVITIGEPMEVLMIAPCFRCNDEIVTLEGVVLNPPPGTSCTYKWYKDGVEIIGATGLTIDVNMGDVTYTFEATCGPCTKSVSYFLRQCGIPFVPICLCTKLADDVGMGFTSNAVAPFVYEFQPTAPLQSCDQVSWDWGDGSPASTSTGADAVQHAFAEAGTWPITMTVSRTDSSGTTCTEVFQMSIVGSKEASPQPLQVRVFPNPSAGAFSLVFEGAVPAKGELQILDTKGSIMLQIRTIPQTQQYPIAITGLPAGVYWLRVLEEGVPVWMERIVKQ